MGQLHDRLATDALLPTSGWSMRILRSRAVNAFVPEFANRYNRSGDRMIHPPRSRALHFGANAGNCRANPLLTHSQSSS
jgi:hypothetical protein